MLLVQKIFYFHLATWMALAVAVSVCAIGSAMYLFKENERRADRVAFAAAETGRGLLHLRPDQRIAVGGGRPGASGGNGTPS